MKQIAPCLVEFNHLVDVVVRKATLGVVRSYHIGMFSKHRYVQHDHHHEMLKLKISLPRNSIPPIRYPKMAPPFNSGKPACAFPRAT